MKKITNESLFDLKNISQTLVAGDNVFYLETQMSKSKNKYLTSIYRLNLHTNERTHFGDSGASNTQMKLSPDQLHLSYLSNNTENEKIQLFLIPLTGGSAVQLTHEEQGVSNYVWVPDKQTIYYQTFFQEEEVQVATEENKPEKKRPNKKVFTKLKYKADGMGYLAEDKCYQIKKLDLHDLNQLPEAEIILEEERALTVNYVAKDESYLLYYDQINPKNEWVYGGTIYRYDLATKERENLTQSVPQGIFTFALASADERYFLFIGNDFAYKFVTNDAIYLYDQDQQKLTNLTATLDFGVGDSLVGDFQQNLGGPEIYWLKDGASFLFKVTEQGKITLYEGNIQGQVRKVIDEEKHLTSFALTEDQESLIMTYSNPVTPSKLARMDLTDGKLTIYMIPMQNFLHSILSRNQKSSGIRVSRIGKFKPGMCHRLNR